MTNTKMRLPVLLLVLIEAKVPRCFDEMVAIIFVGVDLDDLTTNVRDVAP